jgi:hypothetical protein
MTAQTPEPVRLSLRMVVYREGKYWFAHCLDMDIVAEGNSPTQALADLLDLMAFQIEVACNEAEFTGLFKAAPPEIWELFSRGSDLKVAPPFPPMVQSLEAREVTVA